MPLGGEMSMCQGTQGTQHFDFFIVVVFELENAKNHTLIMSMRNNCKQNGNLFDQCFSDVKMAKHLNAAQKSGAMV